MFGHHLELNVSKNRPAAYQEAPAPQQVSPKEVSSAITRVITRLLIGGVATYAAVKAIDTTDDIVRDRYLIDRNGIEID